eukprot:s1588_g5.t2
MRILLTPVWLQSVRARIAEFEQSNTETKRAPPPTVAMLLSLELTVMSVGSFTDYFRATAWLILLCTWACLRLSDLEGLVPSRLELGSRGLRGVRIRTKTTGPGKQENKPLLDKIGVMYFTGRSMRHFLPTVAAAININKEQRDYVGRRVTEGVADAVCKTCRKAGRAVEDEVESSSSGSSSSTDEGFEDDLEAELRAPVE